LIWPTCAAAAAYRYLFCPVLLDFSKRSVELYRYCTGGRYRYCRYCTVESISFSKIGRGNGCLLKGFNLAQVRQYRFLQIASFSSSLLRLAECLNGALVFLSPLNKQWAFGSKGKRRVESNRILQRAVREGTHRSDEKKIKGQNFYPDWHG